LKFNLIAALRQMQFCRDTLVVAIGLFLLSGLQAAELEAPLGRSPNFSRLLMDGDATVGEVQAFKQDRHGFIWIGGKTGLARYDGYRFKIFVNNSKDEHSLSASFIRDIVEDSQGQIWIGTDGGGVLKYNRDLENFDRIEYADTGDAPADTKIVGNRRFEIINRIYEDSHKNLFFAGNFGIGRYDPTSGKIVQELSSDALKKYLINSIAQVGDNDYLVTAANGGYYWRRNEGIGEDLLHKPGDLSSLPTNVLRDVMVDSYRNIWVAHDKGISRFRLETKDFENIFIPNANPRINGTPIWSIFEDNKRMLWLASDGNGVMYLDPVTRNMGGYSASPSYASLSKAVVRRIYQDRAGDYWVGMFPAGASYYDSSNNSFSLYNNFVKNREGEFRNQVWAFQEDELGNLWLGIDDLGLVYFDRSKNTFSQTYQGFDFSNKGFPRTVLSIFKDSHNNLWFGSWAEGIGRINLKTKQYELFTSPKNSNPNTVFPAKHVWQMIETRSGEIYFATSSNGFVNYSYSTDEFVNHKRDPSAPADKALLSDNVWHMYENDDGRIWMGTSSGIAIYDPKTAKIEKIAADPDSEHGLSHYWVTSFLKDSKGRFWVSTMGGGLNQWHPESRRFTRYRAVDGLGSDGVQGVIEGSNGVLWISTRVGLTAFDPEAVKFTQYSDKNWLQKGEYNSGAYVRLRNGELAFGGVNGFNVFDPKNVTVNNYIPPIYFTEFELFDKSITASMPDSPLKKSIIDTDVITLNHDQDVFSLAFTALSYRAYSDNKYRYILEGFDSEWREATTVNRVTYTHMDPGRYTFRVRGSNNADLWNPDEKILNVVVLPPLWRTWWAYLLYTVAVVSIIGWYVHIQRAKIRNAAVLNAKLIELDRLKANFMANTSHELRTPVNGILGMANELRAGDDSGGSLSAADKDKVDVILSCGRRLSRLVNDVLDFSAISESQLLLKCRCVNLVELLPEVIAECHIQHVNPSIKIENQLKHDLPLIYVDETRMFTVFYNIVSNAFKFTERGLVRLTAIATDTEVSVRISDTGIGIDKNDIERIFSSFSQIAGSGVNQQNGTGLGMAITKYLVELHGGTLVAESTKGVGSVFTVTLLRATAAQVAEFDNARAVAKQLPVAVEQRQSQLPNLMQAQLQSHGVQLPVFYPKSYQQHPEQHYLRVLVTDDERVNRMVLRHMLLRRNCIVYEAVNGEEAVDAFDKGFVCDLLLLDIMMPKLSGIEACNQIRRKFSADELPIIFVTAKTQQQDKDECMAAGGDDFLTKPITNEELYAHMDLVFARKGQLQKTA
jgi:two-component system, sensor histidine kinase ChiS